MFRSSIKLAFAGCMLLAISGCDSASFRQWLAGAKSYPATQKAVAPAQPVGTPNLQDLNADTKTDINAKGKYETVVYQMLGHENFDDLDQLADTLRKSKSLFPGGTWKL